MNELFLQNEKTITISMNNRYKNIELDERIKYRNKEYDITIIELKEKDGINNYLEIGENIIKKDIRFYLNSSIYIYCIIQK